MNLPPDVESAIDCIARWERNHGEVDASPLAVALVGLAGMVCELRREPSGGKAWSDYAQRIERAAFDRGYAAGWDACERRRPEIALKMIERYERENCRLKDAIKLHQCRCSDRLETMSRSMIDYALWAEVWEGEAK